MSTPPQTPQSFDIVNRGPSTATNVVVADTLDPALDFVSATPGLPACTALLQTVRCSFATLGRTHEPATQLIDTLQQRRDAKRSVHRAQVCRRHRRIATDRGDV